MAARDNLHSRVVAWMKVILPLIALVILSTLFMVARHGKDGVTLPFSQKDLAEMAREQRVLRPRFAGVTEQGRKVEVAAETATPRDGDHNVVDATELSGSMETGDQGRIDVSSRSGTILAERSRVILRGEVEIVTSTGYTIETDELESSLDRAEMETPGPVTANGPLGHLEAGRMEVTLAEDDQNDVTVVFKDGVWLVYLPPNQ